MKLKTTITPLDTQTFEYQNYSNSDERLIAQSNLDTAFTASTDYIEYYVYDQNQNLIFPSTTIPLAEYNIREGDVLLNPELNLENKGFDIGTYNILYTFYRKQLSSNPVEKYFISEISSDRTEVRLDSNIIANELIISSSNSFIQYRENSEYFIDFYLNFGENQTIIANNIKLETDQGIDPTILVKLYEPLPNNFGLKDELWVVEELSSPQLYKVVFPFNPIIEDDFTYISGPNYSLDISQQTGTPSETFSYDTLVSSNITSSINQIQSLLNEKEINININYENYGNFVNFSSAKTRLENFYYKVGLIESSTNELNDFYGLITSNTTLETTYSASIDNISNQIENIIKNFDGYEYFLYFNSGSQYSYPKSNNEPPFQLYSTGSTEVLTWIGSVNNTSPYYGGQSLSASNYDENNRDWLYWSIPEYLRDDSDNIRYELFVDMVGQYYDNVWVYTKDITNKFNADNRLDYGISKDLVADAIRDFSVKLYSNNFNTNDLFTAFLGLTPSGSAFPFPNITGSLPTPSGYEYVDTKISASNDIVPLNDVNKSIYKRIYHNIPYLLKTKGTIAGIRALITSYGIPDTILRISEFGGKDRNESQDYDLKQNVFNYAFDTGEDSDNFITSSVIANSKFDRDNPINGLSTVQFRFKSHGIPPAVNNVASSDIREKQLLWVNDSNGNDFTQIGSAAVLEYNGNGLVSGSYSGSIPDPYDTWGTLKFYPDLGYSNQSVDIYLPFFNEDWWSVQMNFTGSGTYAGGSATTASLFTANEIDGKIGFSGSGQLLGVDDRPWTRGDFGALNLSSNRTIVGNSYEPFSGSFQEYRMYCQAVSESRFFDYTVNPYSNEGNGINSTPDQQFFRAALGSQLDTGSRTSIHPRVTGSAVQITQSFANDSGFYIETTFDPWVTNVENIYQDQVPAGMKNRITEKVILKNNNLAEAPYGYNTNEADIDGDILPQQGIITASALSPMRSLQVNSSTSQSYTPNVNYLEVAFSPSNQINDDINAQLGYFNLGDYIGDPRFISSPDYSYPDLDRLRDAYFEKYMNSYDVVDFIRLIKFFDNSLFKMIKDFTPARTSLASGIVVKQHLLERNRQRPAQVTSSNETLEGLVVNLPKDYSSGSSDYPQYSTQGSSIYKFTAGAGGVVNKWNGLQSSPSGSKGIGPDNAFYLTQSYDVTGTAREPYAYSEINSTYFNYSSSQFLSASYQGIGIENVSSQHEFYDGEFSGSGIVVSNQALNIDCKPYLKVVDRGVLFEPIFYNGEINTTEQGTVTLTEFNDPNNQPVQGDAWIYSQKIVNPQILLATGANPNYNYVTNIKLSRIDYEGNDVTDYLEPGTALEINLPGSQIFGDGIATYYIEGIIPESNSVRLRIFLERGSNRFWSPSSVLNSKYNNTTNSAATSIGSSYIADSNGNSALYAGDVETITINNVGLGGGNNEPFLSDFNTLGGVGELVINANSYSYIYEITNTTVYYNSFEFDVNYVSNTNPTNLLPTSNPSTAYNIKITSTSATFFPITSSVNGGSENWSFKVETFYTSSDIYINDTDLWQQNNFNNVSSLSQTQYITTWADEEGSYISPVINAITPSQYYQGFPLSLGENNSLGGTQGQYLAGGMLNQQSQQLVRSQPTSPEIWKYGSYTLTRTPNIPLNFIMQIHYSASNNDTGASVVEQSQKGNYHLAQGYDSNQAGNFSQAFTLNDTSGTSAFYYISNTGETTLSAALAKSATNGFTPLYFAATTPPKLVAPNFLYDDPGLNNVNDLLIRYNLVSKFYTIYSTADNSIVGAGAIVSAANNFNNFSAFSFDGGVYNTNSVLVKNYGLQPGIGTSSTLLSGVFRPSTNSEGLSAPYFMDTFNKLIPGNSGSTSAEGDVNLSGGHPKILTNGTASLNYDFAGFTISGSNNQTGTSIYAPFSGSSVVNTNGGFNPTTSNTYYDISSSLTIKDGSIAFNSSLTSSWLNNFVAPNVYEKGFISLSPNFSYTLLTAFPTGSNPSIEVAVQYKTIDIFGNSGNWTTISSTTTSTPSTSYQSTLTVPTGSSGVSVIRDFKVYSVNSAVGNTFGVGPSNLTNGPMGEVAWRLAVKSDTDFLYDMTTFSISSVFFLYKYKAFPSDQQFLLGTSTRTSGNGTLENGNPNNSRYQYNANFTNPSLNSKWNMFEAVATTPIYPTAKIQAFLKYTGSINDGTPNGTVVDVVLTASSKETWDIYPGQVINLSANSTNVTGIFSNPLPYDSSTNASSSLNISGGMYYLEYSMSEYDSTNVPTQYQSTTVDFDTNSIANDQFIGITQSIISGTPSVPDPTATIYPNIIYGNVSNPQTTFGEEIQFIGGEEGHVSVPNSQSEGEYIFSGSFFPTAINNQGWSIGDTFRMSNTVVKTGTNIGVTITSASFQISPGQSIYSPITASVFEPNVFRVPTLTEFIIPTFYDDGVLPFSFAVDCQPLLNNYNIARPNSYLMRVDYNNESGPVIPTNQNQILENIAVRAAVPDSNYTTLGWTTPRYNGSRSTCQSTNIYTYGDTGTYGQTPNIEIRLAYFAYFESIANPYPLYNNVTQLNVAYLIDEQENALPPSLNGQSFEIMNTLYPPQSQVSIQINSGSNVIQELNGLNNISSVGKKYEPIVFTQTSSQGYSDEIPLSGSGRISVYDNVGSSEAKTIYGVSVMGSGVTDTDEQAQLRGSNTFTKILKPNQSIVTSSYNNVNNPNGEGPYSSSNGVFHFNSPIDNTPNTPLVNPQTIYLDTTFVTSFLYESGDDEMTIKLRCILERNGTTTNIPFELEDIVCTAYYLGQSRLLGSVLGTVENGGSWRSGQMVKFVSSFGGETSTVLANSNNVYWMRFENPVMNDLLMNRGVMWKDHGGVENGGRVEYIEFNVTANTDGYIFEAGDKVSFELFGNMTQTGRGLNRLTKFYPQGYSGDSFLPTNYTVIGGYDSADGDNTASAPYWFISSSNDRDTLEMESPNFNEAYGSAWTQGYLPYISGPSEFFEGGFEPSSTKFPKIKKPLVLKRNDEIRFVNSEAYTYKIINVIPPQENINSSGNGRLKIKLDREVNSSINLDFFVVRRPSDDASITYIDVDFPYDTDVVSVNFSSSDYSSPGLILPEFPSEYINISASQIINNLISKGVIKS